MKLVNHRLVFRMGLREVKLSGNEAGLLFQSKVQTPGISSAVKHINAASQEGKDMFYLLVLKLLGFIIEGKYWCSLWYIITLEKYYVSYIVF